MGGPDLPAGEVVLSVRRLAAPVLLATGLVLVGVVPGAVAADGPCGTSCGGGGSAGGGGGGDVITVTVTGSSVIPGGGSVPIDTSKSSVHPLCWYTAFATGKSYAEDVESGRVAERGRHSPDGRGNEVIDGWEAHRDDDKGHWYGGICSSAYWKGDDLDGFFDASNAWFADHDVVWVDAGDAPPAPLVTPEMLVEVASDSMRIPSGDIRWNPTRQGDDATFVGIETWVWLEGAPTSVDVTASVYGGAIWARIDASLDHIDLSAPGAPSHRCIGPGTPWSAGAASTDCSLTFQHSSAGQAVKAGHGQPTSTVRATATWRATWTSSADATPTALTAPAPVAATAEVPVAEIQSVVDGS
jgi:hypothetical protein